MISDTISAIATPLGGLGGVGIIRISGLKALKIARMIFKAYKNGPIKPRQATFGSIVDKSIPVDNGILTYFKSPKSYTGENVIELSCHGGPVILKHILKLTIVHGARLADRGEFTKRAFLNGKLDLAQAEAVNDIISAKTMQLSRAAASHLKGALSLKINDIRADLGNLQAAIEASIDFPDELTEPKLNILLKRLLIAKAATTDLLKTADLGLIHRHGTSISIVGRPNVGKSSILNAILRTERAIVCEIPGTTRDTIDETVNIGGIPIRLSDTAGIRKATHKAEAEGINRAIESIRGTDIALLVIDASRKIGNEDIKILEHAKGKRMIIVLNKTDLINTTKIKDIKKLRLKCPIIKVSAKSGFGIKQLERQVVSTISKNVPSHLPNDIMINMRQKQCLARAKECLSDSIRTIKAKLPIDLLSINIKGALMALGEITGEEVSSKIIDKIFKEFCVGK